MIKAVTFLVPGKLYRFPGIAVSLIIFLLSCGPSNSDTTSVPEINSSVSGKTESIVAKPHNTDVPDTVYGNVPHSTARELCEKYQLKANYYLETGNNSRAMMYADSLLQTIQNNALQYKLAILYGRAHFIKGDIFLSLGDNNSAFQNYYEGRKEVEPTHDTCAYADYTSKLGSASYRQANYLVAARYFKQCIGEFDRCNNDAFRKFLNQQGNLDNTGLCYDKYGMTDSAIFYYEAALDYISHHEHEFPGEQKSVETCRGIVFGNLATTYVRLGKLKEAEDLFKRSITINIKKGYANGDAQLTQLKLADLYLKTARLADAQQVLKNIKGALDSLPTQKDWRQNIEARLYKLQSEYYDHLHNPEIAHNYLNAYVALKDSIDDTHKKLVNTDFNREFENIENKYAFAVLRKNNERKTIYLPYR